MKTISVIYQLPSEYLEEQNLPGEIESDVTLPGNPISVELVSDLKSTVIQNDYIYPYWQRPSKYNMHVVVCIGLVDEIFVQDDCNIISMEFVVVDGCQLVQATVPCYKIYINTFLLTIIPR